MAFAAFGIITPMLSVVLSVFMLGLCLGSALGGRWIPVLVKKTGFSAAIFYALAEFLIGIGAFAVPWLFTFGSHFLLAAGQMNSIGYLSLSAYVLTLSIFPWCFLMGTTFPFMMAYIRENKAHDPKSFSFLYTANVLGAMSGTLLTGVIFIELFGFHETLRIAAAGNFCIALASIALGVKQGRSVPVVEKAREAAPSEIESPAASRPRSRFISWILFSTGFCAMAMEVVWTRFFTPVLKTQVYSFAFIVFTYLGATFAGSVLYRFHLKKNSPWPTAALLAILIATVFLPIVANDPRLVRMYWYYPRDFSSAILVLLSICPFCAALGYLTPRLIDDYGGDDPTRAGKAYAINVSGCILGPLFASYILLPQMSERLALFLLGLPFFVFFLAVWKTLPSPQRLLSGAAACLIAFISLFISQDFQDFAISRSHGMEVRRDYAASVVSINETNGLKMLLVNGIGMTSLTPITKFMVDLPMAFHEGKPESALIICFGMGTSYRSALSWGIDTTVVELVPSVTKAFGFYHANAADVLHDPHGRIVIDDGRRFLKRSQEKFDVIVIDPPPPVEAAGSSLLYSTEMHDLIKQHLKPHGILQIWFPGGEPLIAQATVRSVTDSFPYVRCFISVQGSGMHILASMDPIAPLTPAQLIAKMPKSAKEDLLEWSGTQDLNVDVSNAIVREFPPKDILNTNEEIRITDDQPMNEYFLLRRSGL